MDRDTKMGGKRRSFPATSVSALRRIGSDDPLVQGRAFALIVRAYWKPVYLRIRRRHGRSNEEAKDLTQAFFTRALQDGTFAAFDAERAAASGARFRTFLRKCCDNFVLGALTSARALKRGGAAMTFELDFAGADEEFLRSGEVSIVDDRHFDEVWMRELWARGTKRLHRELQEGTQTLRHAVVEGYLLKDEDERPTYRELSEQLSCSVTDITNHLHAARRRLRVHLVSSLRELTASEDEFRLEASELFGLTPEELAS